MTQERWDVVVRYLTGPLALQPEQIYRGPVVRIGANPGPGGVRLTGYRGLDDRHAVITAYDGVNVAVAPVGTAQVRVAPHAHVAWEEVQAITGPIQLADGSAVHLGPVGRGITLQFVEARRLGVWEEQRILSEASQATPEVEPTQVKEISTQRGVPAWFIGGIVMVGVITAISVMVSVIRHWQRPIAGLGPIDEGKEYYDYVPPNVTVSTELREGLDQPMADFVMIPNSKAAVWPEIADDPKKWDRVFVDMVARSFKIHSNGWAFWARLEQISNDYAVVVGQLREAGLPEVFAAIPYRESQYRPNATSPVCAKGYFQFMPEVGHHYGLDIGECTLRGVEGLWTPTRDTPPNHLATHAEYMRDGICILEKCNRDERSDLRAATKGAVALLKDAMNDPLIKDSGAAVQITITSVNAGYDDGRFDEKQTRGWNVLPAYKGYLQEKKVERGPNFIGDSLKCADVKFSPDRCGSPLFDQAQHYAYNIVAQHFLAVCYYGLNHDDNPVFKDWGPYVRSGGYCSRANIPDGDEVRRRIGR
jgi:hypothetical protein